MNSVVFSGVERFPSKLVCVGRNYLEHIKELKNSVPEQMVLFFKPNASISSELRATDGDEELHFEGEICFGVEGGEFRFVGFGLDLTKRGLQDELRKKGLPWERSKSFRGAALFSDFVPLSGSVEKLSLQLWIDGELVQEGGVCDMMHGPRAIWEEVERVTDLEDFDVVMTGTPKGVGPVRKAATYEGIILRDGEELLRKAWKAGN